MEDMWDIKKVLEIQENTHNKVEVQANSEFRVRLRVQLGVQDHLAFKLMYRTRPTSDLGDLHMHEKLRR
jgi:hypothetical protein